MTGAPDLCVGCGGGSLERFLRVEDVPVMTTVLWPTSAAARQAACGTLDLAICTRCGLIRNLAFDPALVAYSASYENSQHFSPTFREYATTLAAELSERHALAGGVVVEIGSGKGEFLSLLCDAAECSGFGFDPSYDGEVDASSRVEIRREEFGAGAEEMRADLVCCRHVLEHIVDPQAFLDSVAGAVPVGTPVYFEVPDGRFVLSTHGLWDFIYPHVSYFTEPSLDVLFRRCGYEVIGSRRVFGGQFLSIEATSRRAPDLEVSDGLAADVVERARALTAEYTDTIRHWESVLADANPGSTILWGAGAKGVAFLNAVKGADAIGAVVDVNPRKHGRFVPGTGHEVLAPEALADHDVERVLVMNPLYRDEIREQLDALGRAPELLCV